MQSPGRGQPARSGAHLTGNGTTRYETEPAHGGLFSAPDRAPRGRGLSSDVGPLDVFNVPEREKDEVLTAVAAHRDEVTEGYSR